MQHLKQKYGLLIIGITLGVLYGVMTRLVFGQQATLASISYLFVIPTILGVIPLMFADDEKLRSYRNVIFIPWLTVATFFLTLYLFGIEDIICLLILASPFFVLGTAGALIYRVILIDKKRKKGKLLSLVLLPFLLAPIEGYVQSPSDVFVVKSELVINALPETIWENIVEVKEIRPEEYNSGFFNSIGIPRPISATVSSKEIGGQRVGNFEGGLQFIETITSYRENDEISFSIKVDPATIRSKVFDQHVLNGNYFSFVGAAYELEELEEGAVKLILSSSYRLSSGVNFYGKFWGDLILADFQDRLLEVIEKRCEIKGENN